MAVDELDFRFEKEMLFKTQGELLKKNFEKRYVQTNLLYHEEEVYEYIRTFIEDRPYIKNIAFSDGVTLYQLNLFEWVSKELGGVSLQ